MRLTGLVPDGQSADFLAAVLLDGRAAHDAWDRWTARQPDIKAALANDAVMARPLLPLLYDSVRRNNLTVDAETTTYLRSAFLTESIRSRSFRAIVDELRVTLDGVPFVIIKGAATGPMFYPDAALRHAHDIEILTSDARRAAAALEKSFRGFAHVSGLPVRLHECVPIPRFDHFDATVALALTLVHAARSAARRSARWVCDACMIVRTGEVDWRRFLDLTSHASITTHAQLTWLSDALGIALPDDVIAALKGRASRASIVERIGTLFRLHAYRIPLLRRFYR